MPDDGEKISAGRFLNEGGCCRNAIFQAIAVMDARIVRFLVRL